MAYLKKQNKNLSINRWQGVSSKIVFTTPYHKLQAEIRYELLTSHYDDNSMECHTLFSKDRKIENSTKKIFITILLFALNRSANIVFIIDFCLLSFINEIKICYKEKKLIKIFLSLSPSLYLSPYF